MKNVELKPGRAGNISIQTPNGKVIVGCDQPYNGDVETYLYFTDPLGCATKTVNLKDLIVAYADISK